MPVGRDARWAPGAEVRVTETAERARRIHRQAIVVDGTSFFCQGWHQRLETAGVTAMQLTVPWDGEGARQAIGRSAEYFALVRREPRLTIVQSVAEICRAKAEGKVGLILASQDGSMLESDPNLVEIFYRIGFRVIQLTYNGRNLLGDGCLEPANAGLSRLGVQMIQAMNRVGMVLDLSHVGERSSLEAMEVSSKPMLFSHSNPRARADSARNITDEQIRKCAAYGGVIGATPYAPITWTGGEKPPDLDDFVGHVEHIVELVGVDHVCFGSDSEATPGAYPRELLRRLFSAHPEATAAFREAHPGIFLTEGFESMEALPQLTETLLARGWSEKEVRNLLGENLLRVYAANWGK
jgi:membrane dipeptidase